MNIAVLFTGQVRLNHSFKENIDFFLSDANYNFDFFCSTWFEENINYSNLQNLFNFKVFDVETYNSYTSFLIKDYENFHKFCLNYKSEDLQYKNYSHPGWIDASWKHSPTVFYKLYKGYNIINQYSLKNNKKYDLILRLRFDCFLRDKISNQELFESITDNCLHVFQHDYNIYSTKFGENEYFKYQNGWIDDTIFFGSMSVFESFSKIYYEYYNICEKENVWIIHLILKKYIETQKIKVKTPKFKIAISRPDTMINIFDYLF